MKADELIALFAECESPKERLQVLMDVGEELEDCSDVLRNEKNKVPGCVSTVFISAEYDKDKKIYFISCADALVVKGYLFILQHLLSGLAAKEILRSDKSIQEFITHTHIDVSLIPSRANAFQNIFEFMKKKVKELPK